MQFRVLISDLDGTLIDTLQDMANAVNTALCRLQLPPHEVSEYRYFVGDGRRTMALRALPYDQRDDCTLEQLLAYIAEEYDGRWIDNSVPYPGIPEMLDELTRQGIRLAVLSNKPQVYAGPMISTILSGWHFEHVLGESPDRPRKPAPAGALQIIERMNVLPQECIYLGDSGVDMETARAAGMYGVGALWGFRDADELTRAGASLLAHHPADVVTLVNHSLE